MGEQFEWAAQQVWIRGFLFSSPCSIQLQDPGASGREVEADVKEEMRGAAIPITSMKIHVISRQHEEKP